MAWGDLSTGQKIGTGLLGGAGLGGGIYNLLSGGGSNPSKGAMKYLDQIPGQISPYYDPYIQMGNRELPQLESEYGQLVSDPNAFISKLASGYTQSPGYDFRMNQGLTGINNAAAAGGMLGTPQHQQQAGELANQLASTDFNNYMDRVLGLLGTGLSGQEGLGKMGFQASGSLADAIAQVLGQKAQYQYAGQAGQNQQQSQGWGNLLGGLGTIASAFI